MIGHVQMQKKDL